MDFKLDEITMTLVLGIITLAALLAVFNLIRDWFGFEFGVATLLEKVEILFQPFQQADAT